MIKKICVISAYYPSVSDPHYAFVGTLISTFADKGIECHVISPVSTMEKKHRAVSRIETTTNGAQVHVYCPTCLWFPDRNILGFQTYRLTVCSRRNAIKRTFDKYVKSCDAIYSHFIDSAANAAWLSKKTGIPAFAAIGESNITMKRMDYTLYRDELHSNIRGVVSVSSKLKRDARAIGVFSDQTPIDVFPNSIDTDLFKPLDRDECRAKLGIGSGEFVISFVGGFIKRKGFDKLQEAISRHPNWKCILIGAGELPVTLPPEQVVFSGRIPHERIPEYICASDVFALPTQAEGCCNAIVEAMGCGLPIVSSNREFNEDILDDTNSIRIDPDSIDECEEALIRIENDPKIRETISARALQKGRELSVLNRADGILRFMEKNL